jgi:hypothetical protein
VVFHTSVVSIVLRRLDGCCGMRACRSNSARGSVKR